MTSYFRVNNKVEEVKKEGCQPENDFTEYDTMPRKMVNGDLSFPFSCAFVMKNVKSFDAVECTLDVSFTMIMRVKVHNTLLDR